MSSLNIFYTGKFVTCKYIRDDIDILSVIEA